MPLFLGHVGTMLGPSWAYVGAKAKTGVLFSAWYPGQA